MNYAVIFGEDVENIILFDEPPSEGFDVGPGRILVLAPEGVGIGHTYVNGVFLAPPPPTAPPAEPRRVSRIEFSRLFSGVQQVRINALRKAVAALTVADYSDPAQGLTVQLELVFQNFDLPDEFIELDHPDLALALGLLDYAGVFGTDGATEIPRIIGGDPPV